jgi:hypothetical protein
MTVPLRFSARHVLCAALLGLCASLARSATADEADAPFSRWLTASEVSGSVMYFQRHRERYRIDLDRYTTNLHHRTLQTRLDFASAFAADAIGLDLGVFATTDLENDGSPDHEINFFPWRDPWSADWSQRNARDGGSLYRAHLKVRQQGDNASWWGKLGYFQPSGPGVLGVNWALMPGTYRGMEGGGEIRHDAAKTLFAAAWVNAYKAPWYRDIYHFRDGDGERVRDMYSLGLRHETGANSAELAWGEARGYMQNAHLKLKTHHAFATDAPIKALDLTYQLYGASDRARGNDAGYYGGGRAWQHYLAAHIDAAPYAAKVEFTHSRAPSRAAGHLGYFVYRLSGAYGGTNGAYEPWWDNRSDWNHHRESALFLSLARKLDDLLPTPGFTLTLSAARGQGGKVYGVAETLRESAWSVDLTWLAPGGALKDTRIGLHYTRYDNHTHQPSWEGFKNLFQDERDIKFIVIIPWQI